MSENWLTWYLSATVAAAGGIGSHLGLLFLTEHNTDKAKLDYVKFIDKIPSLRKLEEEIGMEAWRWPMYARPVFYTPIDHDAQVFFSTAQHAIHDARELEGTIKLPPERPQSWRALMSFENNWNRYVASLNIQKEVAQFEKALRDIADYLFTLQQSHKKEELLQENTKESLAALGKKIEETGARVKGQSRGKKFDENVDWALRNANNCYLEAQSQLNLSPNDGINFAIADLFIQLGDYILEHFDLYEKEFAVPVRFELDHFENHLMLFQKCIAVMLTESIDNWQILHATGRMLVLVNQQMERARRSLSIFFKKQEILRELEHQIQTLNFPQIVDEARKIEKECEDYWMPLDQDQSIWSKVLGSNPLPNVDLDDARRSYQVDILPLVGADAVIKQTSMIKLIDDTRIFLQKIGKAKTNTINLLDELNVHKQAQTEVNFSLSSMGSTYEKVKELAPIEADTSREVERRCITCRKDFDVFQARARAVQGANFPEMLTELDLFENFCLQVKLQHEVLIEGLRRQASELAEQLLGLQNEIADLVGRRPRIEYDVTEINQRVILGLNSYSNTRESYHELKTYISQVKPIITGAKKDRNQLDKLWQKFVIVYNKTGQTLDKMQQSLDEYQLFGNESWVWIQKEYKRALRPASNSYNKFRKELEKLTTVDITIKQAIDNCQHLQDEIKTVLNDLSSKLEPFRIQQQHFANTRYELEANTKRTTMFSFGKNADLVRAFCERAEKAKSVEGITINLDLAQRLLEQSLPREEAMRIITNEGTYVERQIVRRGGTAYNAGRNINR